MDSCLGPRLATGWQIHKADVNGTAKAMKSGMYVETTNMRSEHGAWTQLDWLPAKTKYHFS